MSKNTSNLQAKFSIFQSAHIAYMLMYIYHIYA